MSSRCAATGKNGENGQRLNVRDAIVPRPASQQRQPSQPPYNGVTDAAALPRVNGRVERNVDPLKDFVFQFPLRCSYIPVGGVGRIQRKSPQ